jgi:hypothetical protein
LIGWRAHWVISRDLGKGLREILNKPSTLAGTPEFFWDGGKRRRKLCIPKLGTVNPKMKHLLWFLIRLAIAPQIF